MMEIEKLKFKKRISVFLTEEEKEEIAKRIVKFMRECLVIEDKIYEPEKEGNKRYKFYHYYFEEGHMKFRDSYYSKIFEADGKFEIPDSHLFWEFEEMGGMFERFRYHIRMNASLPHIKKLIELLGDKVAMFYLGYWAKKNVAVGIILNKIVQELKEKNGLK